MRNILSRNPAAFDTKFKKDPTAMVVLTSKVTGTPPGKITQPAPPVAVAKSGTEESPLEGVPAKLETIASNAASTTDASRALAHRLGCKCRKSACMKKVCYYVMVFVFGKHTFALYNHSFLILFFLKSTVNVLPQMLNAAPVVVVWAARIWELLALIIVIITPRWE